MKVTVGSKIKSDCNHDGQVNILDLSSVLSNYGK